MVDYEKVVESGSLQTGEKHTVSQAYTVVNFIEISIGLYAEPSAALYRCNKRRVNRQGPLYSI